MFSFSLRNCMWLYIRYDLFSSLAPGQVGKVTFKCMATKTILGRKLQGQWTSDKKKVIEIHHFHFLKLLSGTSTKTKDKWTVYIFPQSNTFSKYCFKVLMGSDKIAKTYISKSIYTHNLKFNNNIFYSSIFSLQVMRFLQ